MDDESKQQQQQQHKVYPFQIEESSSSHANDNNKNACDNNGHDCNDDFQHLLNRTNSSSQPHVLTHNNKKTTISITTKRTRMLLATILFVIGVVVILAAIIMSLRHGASTTNNISNSYKSKSLGSCPHYRLETPIDQQAIANVSLDHITTYVMFFGFARSGHSWIGSILDAAPNAMIANEHHALGKYYNNKMFLNQTTNNNNWTNQDLFRDLVENSYLCGKYGRIQSYNYTIPGLWQGKVADNNNNLLLQVIGDKRGSASTYTLLKLGRKPWEYEIHAQAQKQFMDEFIKFIGVEPKFLIVLRNPFDMIASRKLDREQTIMEQKKKKSGISQEQQKLNIQYSTTEHIIKEVFKEIKQVLWAKDNLAQRHQWHVLTKEQFAKNTQDELFKLCNFTQITCPPILMTRVEQQTLHRSESASSMIPWTEAQVEIVQEFIDTYLSDYY